MNAEKQRVLISGASLAGLTTAFWLAKYGFEVTVVERASQPRRAGNGVDVRGEAVEVVERMGLLPQVRSRATDVQGMMFVTADGRTAGRIDLQAIQRKSGSGEVEVMRGDLVGLLYAALGSRA